MNLQGNSIKFTQGARVQIKRLMENESKNANKFLRLGAKNGGCAGFSYIFEFDDKRDSDLVEQMDGFSVIIDKDQISMIQNLEVDYQSGLNNRGFIFNNPNAKSTCGCGTSFS